jgi:hypothetical protein
MRSPPYAELYFTSFRRGPEFRETSYIELLRQMSLQNRRAVGRPLWPTLPLHIRVGDDHSACPGFKGSWHRSQWSFAYGLSWRHSGQIKRRASQSSEGNSWRQLSQKLDWVVFSRPHRGQVGVIRRPFSKTKGPIPVSGDRPAETRFPQNL